MSGPGEGLELGTSCACKKEAQCGPQHNMVSPKLPESSLTTTQDRNDQIMDAGDRNGRWEGSMMGLEGMRHSLSCCDGGDIGTATKRLGCKQHSAQKRCSFLYEDFGKQNLSISTMEERSWRCQGPSCLLGVSTPRDGSSWDEVHGTGTHSMGTHRMEGHRTELYRWSPPDGNPWAPRDPNPQECPHRKGNHRTRSHKTEVYRMGPHRMEYPGWEPLG